MKKNIIEKFDNIIVNHASIVTILVSSIFGIVIFLIQTILIGTFRKVLIWLANRAINIRNKK